ncbi:unknown [Bacteroides sp. CAG:661]|nr:unknown [Bacteroides sp. CAG:661]
MSINELHFLLAKSTVAAAIRGKQKTAVPSAVFCLKREKIPPGIEAQRPAPQTGRPHPPAGTKRGKHRRGYRKAPLSSLQISALVLLTVNSRFVNRFSQEIDTPFLAVRHRSRTFATQARGKAASPPRKGIQKKDQHPTLSVRPAPDAAIPRGRGR